MEYMWPQTIGESLQLRTRMHLESSDCRVYPKKVTKKKIILLAVLGLCGCTGFSPVLAGGGRRLAVGQASR